MEGVQSRFMSELAKARTKSLCVSLGTDAAKISKPYLLLLSVEFTLCYGKHLDRFFLALGSANNQLRQR